MLVSLFSFVDFMVILYLIMLKFYLFFFIFCYLNYLLKRFRHLWFVS